MSKLPFFKQEDWLAVILGFAILGVSFLNVIVVPKIPLWEAIPTLSAQTLFSIGTVYILLAILSGLIAVAIGSKIARQIAGFSCLFLSGLAAIVISKQTILSNWGLEYVIWALLIGLVLGNVRLPDWLKSNMKSEVYIKTGLVLLGAEIILNNLLSAGLAGVFEVTVGLVIVWYFCYWLARKLGLSQSFASILASATSICGVSAAIAAGGAVKGDPKEVSHTISLVLLFSMPLLILMPAAAKMLGLTGSVAGAWIGGVIDTTPAVVAAGALYSDAAMKTASIVKMSQNMMIAVAAFTLSLYWAVRVEKKPEEKPNLRDIWTRFPKFVLGFMLASIAFTILPMIGIATGPAVGVSKELRGWLFSMAFVSIGINTNFNDLVKTGGGKPLIVFTAATILDIAVSLVSALIFFR
jgi:uncharacterized integral membrane protein (TIGR00698 family)